MYWKLTDSYIGMCSLPASGKVECFEDEKPRPSITSLTAHFRKDHTDNLKLAATAASYAADPEVPKELSGASASARLLDGYIKEGVLNPTVEPMRRGFLKVFTAWLIEDDLPFTTGESPALQRVFDYLKIKWKLPSDTTVRKVLDEINEELWGNVIKELMAVSSKISYSHDVWTNRQMIFSFAGIMAYWIDDDWKIVERLIDFKHLDEKEHIGQYGVKEFYHSANNWIRCLAHVVNLVVQAILKAVDEAGCNSDEEDYYLLNKEAPFHYEESEDDELIAMEEEENVEVDEEHQDSDVSELPENARNLSAVKRASVLQLLSALPY
ncbi:hypothetical protein D9758_015634 [Tetrapyrgos nigripes]|uniref:Uncharacterized protein n=1 Tax=Tetrapyrgos nigripes TaxID=182062 RepID=A0A8H5CKM8_9AGAR|nr:hypothetical protein D9758_015634 [Tetrapyrgos nigripes]